MIASLLCLYKMYLFRNAKLKTYLLENSSINTDADLTEILVYKGLRNSFCCNVVNLKFYSLAILLI
jgi:hypothetical protein